MNRLSHWLPVPGPARRPLFRPRLETLDDRITPNAAFHSMVSFGTGSNPTAVAVGDFNGDGWADLVTCDPDNDAVMVLLNLSSAEEGNPDNGIPEFDASFSFTVGDEPGGVAVADFNGDGRDDIAVINRQANTVSVLRNITPNLSHLPDGDTSVPLFAAKVDLPLGVGTFASDIVAGDFNGDGRMDLAVSFVNGGGGVALFKNTSPFYEQSVSFAAATLAAVPNLNPQGLVAADLNGDGRTDLAVSLFNNSQVAVLRNTTAVNPNPTTAGFDPAITFAAAQTFATKAGSTAVKVGDFDGDGKFDLVVLNEGNNSFSVLRNATANKAATFTFAAQQVLATQPNPRGLAVGDFDGDGRTDVAVAGTDGDAAVWSNTTAAGATVPTFDVGNSFAVSGSTRYGLVAADFDRDGRTDLALPLDTGHIGLLENATESVSTFGNREVTVGARPNSVAVGDFDGDGKLDLATANFSGNTVSVLRNTSTVPGVVSYAAQQTFAAGTGPFSVAVGDFDGDGKLDLAVTNFINVGTVSVLRNTSPAAGTIAFAQQVFALGSFLTSVAVGDFDGDGKPDLAVTNRHFPTVSVLRNTSSGVGVVSYAANVDFAVGSGPYSVAVGDFDGDGRPDLATANFSDNTVSVLRNISTVPGVVSYAANVDFAVGSKPNSVAVCDFDGDGNADLVVANSAGNTVSVLRNTSSGVGVVSYAAQQTFAVGARPNSVAVGDFDGDSTLDLAVANLGSGSVSVLRNTSPAAGTIAFAIPNAYAVGTGPSSVAVGDFDGDSTLELAVANVESNTVSVMRNTPTVPVTGPAVVVAKSDGVWAYDRIANGWRQLLSTPATHVAAAANGNAIAVFPNYGTYYYRASTATWTRLHTTAANAVAMDRLGNAYANFSGDPATSGTYRFAPGALVLGNNNAVYGWVKLEGTGASATLLAVAGNGDVVASYTSFGVYRFRPLVGWQKLNGVDAATLAIGDNGQIVVTFKTSAVGVFMWRDGPAPVFAQLHGYNATNLAVDGNGNVAATFNSPTLPGGVQVARSRVKADNSTIDWDTIHTGTVGTSIATDLFGNAYFQLTGFGVYEYSVYPGYTKRASFAITGIGVSR